MDDVTAFVNRAERTMLLLVSENHVSVPEGWLIRQVREEGLACLKANEISVCLCAVMRDMIVNPPNADSIENHLVFSCLDISGVSEDSIVLRDVASESLVDHARSIEQRTHLFHIEYFHNIDFRVKKLIPVWLNILFSMDSYAHEHDLIYRLWNAWHRIVDSDRHKN